MLGIDRAMFTLILASVFVIIGLSNLTLKIKFPQSSDTYIHTYLFWGMNSLLFNRLGELKTEGPEGVKWEL